jgi:hypothetical protein
MRTVILLGFYSVSDAIGASTGFASSDGASSFIAVVLGVVIAMDIVDFFANIARG